MHFSQRDPFFGCDSTPWGSWLNSPLVSSLPKLTRPAWGRLVFLGLATMACQSKQKTTSGDPAMVANPGDKDCCMGKNECKGKGGCAVPESHSCAGKNDCKGKGGCNMHCSKK